MKENIIRRNKKKIASGTDLPGKSMLKKSDLSLVFLGAGIITLIIFFVFLRPSGEPNKELEKEVVSEDSNIPISESVKTLEQKLTTLEEMLQAINASQVDSDGKPKFDVPDIKPYVARIERVETAMSVKFDVLTARVDKIDDKLSAIIKDVERNNKSLSNMRATIDSYASKQSEIAASKPVSAPKKDIAAEAKQPSKDESDTIKTAAKSSSKSQEQPDKQTAATTKTASNTKSETASPAKQSQTKPKSDSKGEVVYHTVAKGDTLYNISKRYETTVEQLRAMNKMTINDAIVIGQKIIVKK
ncbi:MAG: LysM peptidoglycan-binding domain-containing protein [Desulfamplus sp.]|nr:LysM peptidoglycan-binding domain-containing protein [Desulfamplus sp.]MBF0242663.1 LysM peptidoglycan-binding domain-containing protein [Desulfamplus sp.]MBF0389678.1 LysM peptidoglycan-binding domain-containing protein [Desulfamplus sp.]